MKKSFGILIATMVAVTAPLTAQDATEIINRARLAATLQENDLTGTIRKDRDKTAVALFLKGQDIQFQYSQNGGAWTPFHMRLGDGKYDLFDFKDRKTVRFPDAKLSQPVAGSDLTFEDLSMRFLYWPEPKLEGAERVKTFDCWKVRIDNPGRSGAYGVVYVWVHKEYGAFMKVEGFDRQGKKLKQFTVEDVMKLPDGSYTLKKMKVSSFKDGRTTGNSFLEFEAPKKAGPRGMR